MTEEVTRIRVGKNLIGINGLKNALKDFAQSHAETSDDEIGKLLIERLSRNNYIPSSAENEYGGAFVREFRKFLGQSYDKPPDDGLTIQVLGPGCPQCDRLEQTIMRTLTEMNLDAMVEHVKDVKEIAEFGVLGTPALVINGKVVCVGKLPSPNQIKEWVLKAQ